MRNVNWTHVLIALAIGALLYHLYMKKTAGTTGRSGGR